MEEKEKKEGYEYVNHPKHYNKYPIETIEIMERVFGNRNTVIFCYMTAFKYRMRLSGKPGIGIEEDIKKEEWYLKKAEEIIREMIKEECSTEEELKKNIEEYKEWIFNWIN